ncbi:MAG: hypothetical protein Q4A83_00010 [Bacillota bacterium]|nr:hypothetical protein [Bacillota bacterium]
MNKCLKNIENDDLRVIALILAVILVAAIVLVVVKPGNSSRGNAAAEPEEISFEDIEIDASTNGISVVSADNILGMYVEDGSNEVIDGIFTVTFKNTAEQTLQYAKLILTIGEEDYTFELSTIPAGETVRAMESNRKSYVPSEGDITLTQENIVWFYEEPTMCENAVEIISTDNGIVVKNISNATITAPLYVYYKNYEDGIYIGGITYRAGTQQDLAAGESTVLSAKHFDSEASRLMFVTYAQ